MIRVAILTCLLLATLSAGCCRPTPVMSPPTAATYNTVHYVTNNAGDLIGGAVMVSCRPGKTRLALTAWHVVDSPVARYIERGKVFVVARHPRADLALIGVPAKDTGCSEATLSPSLERAERVWCIGAPMGVPGHVSDGVVNTTAVERGFSVYRVSCVVLPGSSGGGVFGLDGRLAGIMVHMDGIFGIPISGTGAAVHTSHIRELLAGSVR